MIYFKSNIIIFIIFIIFISNINNIKCKTSSHLQLKSKLGQTIRDELEGQIHSELFKEAIKELKRHKHHHHHNHHHNKKVINLLEKEDDVTKAIHELKKDGELPKEDDPSKEATKVDVNINGNFNNGYNYGIINNNLGVNTIVNNNLGLNTVVNTVPVGGLSINDATIKSSNKDGVDSTVHVGNTILGNKGVYNSMDVYNVDGKMQEEPLSPYLTPLSTQYYPNAVDHVIDEHGNHHVVLNSGEEDEHTITLNSNNGKSGSFWHEPLRMGPLTSEHSPIVGHYNYQGYNQQTGKWDWNPNLANLHGIKRQEEHDDREQKHLDEMADAQQDREERQWKRKERQDLHDEHMQDLQEQHEETKEEIDEKKEERDTEKQLDEQDKKEEQAEKAEEAAEEKEDEKVQKEEEKEEKKEEKEEEKAEKKDEKADNTELQTANGLDFTSPIHVFTNQIPNVVIDNEDGPHTDDVNSHLMTDV